MPQLTDTKIRNAIKDAIKARPQKRRKLYDERGLHLILVPRDKKCGCWWRQDFMWNGKEGTLSVGVYPAIGIKTARQRRDEIREQVANGVDPYTARQEKKVAARDSAERTYEAIAREWLNLTATSRHWTADHIERVRRRQEVHTWPWLGRRPIADITEADVLACLKRVTDKGLIDTAHRLRADTDGIFRYAKKWRFVSTNPMADLRDGDTLPKLKTTHNSAITNPAALGVLLRAIESYPGSFIVKCALKLQALVFVRPGELRLATWDEFDLQGAEWRIPAERMKMRQEHVVPLARQAVAILRELHPLTGPDGYVFPQVRSPSRPISNNTLGAALRTLGFSADQQSAHGFRRTASTLLNESDAWHPDAIERQLAHKEPNKTREAYNAAQHMPARRKMMQAWADYLDTLKKAKANTAAIEGSANPAAL